MGEQYSREDGERLFRGILTALLIILVVVCEAIALWYLSRIDWRLILIPLTLAVFIVYLAGCTVDKADDDANNK